MPIEIFGTNCPSITSKCYIELFADHGADLISVHLEATAHIHRAIEQIKNKGIDNR
jgi:pentose-5-phosphate-3-epimerase